MASIQQKVAVQLSCEQKATLDELIKSAEKTVVSEDIANKSRAIVAEKECLKEADAIAPKLSALAGAMTNKTSGPLKVFVSKLWQGYTVKDYTNPLDSLGSWAQAAVIGGVKAAVVYSGKNRAGVECGWLLAWSDTNNGRKVYADCGPISKFNNINWNLIEKKLDESDFIAYGNDSGTGTSMYATNVGHSAASAVAVAYSG